MAGTVPGATLRTHRRRVTALAWSTAIIVDGFRCAIEFEFADTLGVLQASEVLYWELTEKTEAAGGEAFTITLTITGDYTWAELADISNDDFKTVFGHVNGAQLNAHTTSVDAFTRVSDKILKIDYDALWNPNTQHTEGWSTATGDPLGDHAQFPGPFDWKLGPDYPEANYLIPYLMLRDSEGLAPRRIDWGEAGNTPDGDYPPITWLEHAAPYYTNSGGAVHSIWVDGVLVAAQVFPDHPSAIRYHTWADACITEIEAGTPYTAVRSGFTSLRITGDDSSAPFVVTTDVPLTTAEDHTFDAVSEIIGPYPTAGLLGFEGSDSYSTVLDEAITGSENTVEIFEVFVYCEDNGAETYTLDLDGTEEASHVAAIPTPDENSGQYTRDALFDLIDGVVSGWTFAKISSNPYGIRMTADSGDDNGLWTAAPAGSSGNALDLSAKYPADVFTDRNGDRSTKWTEKSYTRRIRAQSGSSAGLYTGTFNQLDADVSFSMSSLAGGSDFGGSLGNGRFYEVHTIDENLTATLGAQVAFKVTEYVLSNYATETIQLASATGSAWVS